jgi:hypothetical protein
MALACLCGGLGQRLVASGRVILLPVLSRRRERLGCLLRVSRAVESPAQLRVILSLFGALGQGAQVRDRFLQPSALPQRFCQPAPGFEVFRLALQRRLVAADRQRQLLPGARPRGLRPPQVGVAPARARRHGGPR